MHKRISALLIFYSLTVFIPDNFMKAQDVSLELQKPKRFSEEQRVKFWNKLLEPTTIGFTTSSLRFDRQLPPPSGISRIWKVTAWKNEKIHTQIAIASKVKIKKIRWQTNELKNDNGQSISKNSFAIGLVQDVMTDEFKNGCGHRTSTDFDSSLVADIINTNLHSTTVDKNNTQSIWVSLKVPEQIAAGVYRSNITLNADGKPFVLPVELSVLDKALPSPDKWTFQLDLWQHPAAIARVHHVPLWSTEHFDLMRKYYTMLANAGQKFITASIVEEPWNHQTYDDYPSLIQWIKKKDGSWSYDYTLFDKYVRFVMDCGIKEMINCYSMVPWKIAFKYYDELTQKTEIFTKGIGTPEYNQFWSNMLRDFTTHLKNKGWFDITAIAMDERPMKDMQVVIALLKTIDPAWKVSLAGNYHPEIESDIFYYCIGAENTFSDSVLSVRHQQGKYSTWYTACGEKYPNLFTFSPPDEAVWIGWYTASTHMDGYLRWAYNSWTKNPLKDSRFITWPAGDTYQIYPGPLSSIRFEKLIEGIQDFEKIQMLRQIYREKNDIGKLEHLNKELTRFKINDLSKQSAHQMLEKVKNLLND